jgi:hypothetical protein
VRALRATIRLDRLSSWIRDTVSAIFRPESAAPRMVRLRACEPGGRTFESCRAHQPLGNQHLIKPRITAFSLPLNDGHSPDPNLLDIEMRCVWMVWNSMR